MKDESARPRGDIPMKDESVKVSRVTAIKREDASPSPSTSTTTSSKGAARRLPGSGYVAKKSPQPSPAIEAAPRKAVGSVDTRPQKPLPRNPLSTKPAPALAPPPASQEKMPAAAMSMKMTKKTLPPEDSDRERERNRDTDRPPKDRVVTGVKRKSAARDVDDTRDEEQLKVNSIKKRRMEDGPSPATSSSLLKSRDLSLPKKPVKAISPPPKNIKKESSPLPPSRPTLLTQPPPSNLPSKADQRPKPNGLAKARRKSPIYTSSDEGEIPEPPRKPTQEPSVNADRSKGKDGRVRPRSSYPLPADRNGLRSRYQSKYGHYLDTYSQIVAQKRKIEAILNGESEAEGEIMDPEELKRLSAEHKNQKEELEFIQEKWLNGSVSE
jgi:RNA polymerase II elongation factor ELL